MIFSDFFSYPVIINNRCLLFFSHLMLLYFFLFALQNFREGNRPKSVCVSDPHKRFLGNCEHHHHQIWHGDCLGHDNASRVNYIDLDLHSRSHKYDTKYLIISESFQAMPTHHVSCENSLTKGLYNLLLGRWSGPSLKHNCVSKLTNAF